MLGEADPWGWPRNSCPGPWQKSGAWESSGDDEADEVNVALRLADGSVLLPVQRVMKRFQLGDEESLAAYALALGVPVGAPPERPPQKPWWKVWG